jgi:hypothetical protein
MSELTRDEVLWIFPDQLRLRDYPGGVAFRVCDFRGWAERDPVPHGLHDDRLRLAWVSGVVLDPVNGRPVRVEVLKLSFDQPRARLCPEGASQRWSAPGCGFDDDDRLVEAGMVGPPPGYVRRF